MMQELGARAPLNVMQVIVGRAQPDFNPVLVAGLLVHVTVGLSHQAGAWAAAKCRQQTEDVCTEKKSCCTNFVSGMASFCTVSISNANSFLVKHSPAGTRACSVRTLDECHCKMVLQLDLDAQGMQTSPECIQKEPANEQNSWLLRLRVCARGTWGGKKQDAAAYSLKPANTGNWVGLMRAETVKCNVSSMKGEAHPIPTVQNHLACYGRVPQYLRCSGVSRTQAPRPCALERTGSCEGAALECAALGCCR